MTYELHSITANPWQPRLSYDDAYIAELAADIQSRYASRPESCGLLQLPAGRLMYRGKPATVADLKREDGITNMLKKGGTIQLAYGHNRWKAFQLLAQTDARFARLPVTIVEFSDEEMATSAWSENAQRRDINAVEQAKAISKYMTDFGWTQEEVADRLKLDRSTVANKLRLLKLSKSVLNRLAAGELSERQAVALLPLMGISDGVANRAKARLGYSVQKLVQDAAQHSSEILRARVEQVLTLGSMQLPSYEFPTLELAGPGVHAATCTACTFAMRNVGASGTNGIRCGYQDESCLAAKVQVLRDEQLCAASRVTGLRMLDDDHQPYHLEAFTGYPGAAQRVRREGCTNLRVRYGGVGIPIDEVPACAIVCHHSGQGCTCLAATPAGQRIATPQQTQWQIEQAQKNEARTVINGWVTELSRQLATNTDWLLDQALAAFQRTPVDGESRNEHLARSLLKQRLTWVEESNTDAARKRLRTLLAGTGIDIDSVCAQTSDTQPFAPESQQDAA